MCIGSSAARSLSAFVRGATGASDTALQAAARPPAVCDSAPLGLADYMISNSSRTGQTSA